jgi:hypothetical protein
MELYQIERHLSDGKESLNILAFEILQDSLTESWAGPLR